MALWRPKDLFKRRCNLAHGGACPAGDNRQFQQIGIAFCAGFKGGKGLLASLFVARGLDVFEALDLASSDIGIVDAQHIDFFLFFLVFWGADIY